jgi:hypothetical protein
MKTIYKAEYIGLLEVHKEDSIYKFIMGIPSYMSPTTISIEADNDDIFLDFIYHELICRNYVRSDFYKIIKKNERVEE